MKRINLPAGTTHVPFGDLPHLIADALWPDTGPGDDRMAYGAACVNLDSELSRAVDASRFHGMGANPLPVKDPLTLGPHTFPVGDALRTALVTVGDFRACVAERGIEILVGAISGKTLEDALGEMEAKKAQLAQFRNKHASEIEAESKRIAAFNARLDGLSQSERRQVLDAAGLKNISAAPRPITSVRGSGHIPPNLPPELLALAEQQNIEQLERERKRAKELGAMQVPPDGGGCVSRQWLPTESQQPAPATKAAPVAERLGDTDQTPDPERRLALLRALGGSAKYARGEWKFTGMGALVAREKADSRRRSDEKTIRADLKEGAQAERDAKTAGVFNGLGQR